MQRLIRRSVSIETLLWILVTGITVVLVILPLFYIFRTAFSGNWVDTYTYVFTEERLALFNTISISLGACAINFVTAVPIAWAVTRTDMPLKKLVRNLCTTTLVIPSQVSIIGYIILLSSQGYLNKMILNKLNLTFNIYSYLGMMFLISNGTFFFVFIQTMIAFESMDPNLEKAASILGASKLRTLRSITIPILAPAITSGLILAFIMASMSLAVPLYIGQIAGVPYLTRELYTLTTFESHVNYQRASTIAMIFIAFAFTLVIIRTKILGKKQYVTIVSGMQREITRLGRMKYSLLIFCMLVLTFIVFLPLSMVLVMTFSKTWLTGIGLHNLTLQNFNRLLQDKMVTRSFFVSSTLSLVSAAAVIALMSIVSYIINRTRVRGRWFLDLLIWLPASAPGIIMGLGILMAYIRPPIMLYGTIWVLVLAYVTRCMPFVNRTISSAIVQVDESLEEASRMLGGTRIYTLRKVTIPLILPGFIAAFIIAFILSFGEFPASILLYPAGYETVGVANWKQYYMGYYELTATMSLIVLVMTSILFYVAAKISKTGAPRVAM